MLRQVLRSEGGCQTKERARKSRWPHHKTILPRKYRSHRGQLICFAHDISSGRGGLPSASGQSSRVVFGEISISAELVWCWAATAAVEAGSVCCLMTLLPACSASFVPSFVRTLALFSFLLTAVSAMTTVR